MESNQHIMEREREQKDGDNVSIVESPIFIICIQELLSRTS